MRKSSSAGPTQRAAIAAVDRSAARSDRRRILQQLTPGEVLGLVALFSWLAMSGCDAIDQGANVPGNAVPAAAEVHEDGAGGLLCGELICGKNEECVLVDFQRTCSCGAEGPCEVDQECWEYASGELSCAKPVSTGETGCDKVGKECAPGDLCTKSPLGEYYRCMRLCQSSEVFCPDGAFCISLKDPSPYFAPNDGICNVMGKKSAGQSCSYSMDCFPSLFCVNWQSSGATCSYPCDRYDPECPPGYSCVDLESGGNIGACRSY